MNVRVEAGPLTTQVSAVVLDAVVNTQINRVHSHNFSQLTWTCFALAPITINGHSLNAINPDFSKAGELTTSALA
jgi:hypothetical protein